MGRSLAAFTPTVAGNKMKTLALTVTLLGCVVGFSDIARAQSKCDAIKAKEAGKKLFCKAKVHAKTFKKNEPPDTAKLGKCEEKFDAKCAKANARGDCSVGQGPCADLEQVVDDCLAAILGAISNAGESKCDAAKAKEAGKKYFCKLKVHSKAFKKNETPDAAKLTKCEEKFDARCAKATTGDDCTATANDCTSLESLIDNCVQAALDDIDTGLGTGCGADGSGGCAGDCPSGETCLQLPDTSCVCSTTASTTTSTTVTTTTSTTIITDPIGCCQFAPFGCFPTTTSSAATTCPPGGFTPGYACNAATGLCGSPDPTPCNQTSPACNGTCPDPAQFCLDDTVFNTGCFCTSGTCGSSGACDPSACLPSEFCFDTGAPGGFVCLCQ